MPRSWAQIENTTLWKHNDVCKWPACILLYAVVRESKHVALLFITIIFTRAQCYRFSRLPNTVFFFHSTIIYNNMVIWYYINIVQSYEFKCEIPLSLHKVTQINKHRMQHIDNKHHTWIYESVQVYTHLF